MEKVNIFWFRRDLRLHDNTALYHALKNGFRVLPIFIFDKSILNQLEDKADRRVTFIYAAIVALQRELNLLQSDLKVFYDFPYNVFTELAGLYNIQGVYANDDYEPYARERDGSIGKLLTSKNVGFYLFKDHVIFEKEEVMKEDNTPYTVFTPYSKKWLEKFSKSAPFSPLSMSFNNLFNTEPALLISLAEMGFTKNPDYVPSANIPDEVIREYAATRDFPGLTNGTSRMGVHLRFGTISIRQLAEVARNSSAVYLSELIWREFYQMILWHFPRVGAGRAFKPAYEKIDWRNNEQEFKSWTEGNTGYPIVDAGMRQLNATGFMHNRVRMVVASFLTKHVLIDWRWGESYFAQHLLDFELASNSGGWQWAAGCGCDAAPYFRIFNPTLQAKKFDGSNNYIKTWVPEYDTATYSSPIVEHGFARQRALQVYSAALR